MDIILQYIGFFASVLSLPLSILFFVRTCEARQNRVRLEIIKSISCYFGNEIPLSWSEVTAIYKSKIRESNVKSPRFTEVTLLEDIISDVGSNPYLNREDKIRIKNDVRVLIQNGTKTGEVVSPSPPLMAQYSRSSSIFDRLYSIISINKRIFSIILLSAAITVLAVLLSPNSCFVSDNSNYHPLPTTSMCPYITITPNMEPTPEITVKPSSTPITEQPSDNARSPIFTIISIISMSISAGVTILSIFSERLWRKKRKQ